MEDRPGYTRLPNGNWMTPYGEQGESGIAIEQLRENLKLTPTERFEKAQKCLTIAQEVRRAGEEYRRTKRHRIAE